MRGDLTLESTEGVGSTFTLTLPLASEKPADTPAGTPTDSASVDSPYAPALAP
jgi:hypothetical protein